VSATFGHMDPEMAAIAHKMCCWEEFEDSRRRLKWPLLAIIAQYIIYVHTVHQCTCAATAVMDRSYRPNATGSWGRALRGRCLPVNMQRDSFLCSYKVTSGILTV
jgi:hypothetical protein